MHVMVCYIYDAHAVYEVYFVMKRSIFFFFFQAEDGIRDGHVTGVQTCALPILEGVGLKDHRDVTVSRRKLGHVAAADGDAALGGFLEPGDEAQECRLAAARRRSEERRVGKECKAGWWG